MIEIVLLIVNMIMLILIMGMANELVDIRDYIFFKEALNEGDLRDSEEL